MKLLFHTLYRWSYYWESWGTPELSAMYTLGITLWMDAISIVQLIRIAIGSPVFDIAEHLFAAITLLIVITLIIYRAYVQKGRYKIIDHHIIYKDGYSKSRGDIVTTIYLLLIIGLFFRILLLKNQAGVRIQVTHV